MQADTQEVTLDVRPILAEGGEPFELIMRTASGIPDGGVFELIAPFDPVPLYAVMSSRGFVSRTAERDDGVWVVRFTRTAITPRSTVAEVHERHPGTADVFARHGIDLCCGGHLSLDHVAAAQSLELDAFIQELNSAIGG